MIKRYTRETVRKSSLHIDTVRTNVTKTEPEIKTPSQTNSTQTQTQTSVQTQIPPLSRPIGFPYPPRPVPAPRSTIQNLKTLFSSTEAVAEQRRDLLQEAGKSYWADFHASRLYEGKQWIAPKYPFKADRALYFPNLRGRTLDRDDADLLSCLNVNRVEGVTRVSLIRIFSATIGEKHVHGLGDDVDGLVTIDVNVQANPAKYLLLSLFLNSIRKIVAKERHGRYLVLKGDQGKNLQGVGVVNAYVGYSFLLDAEAKIRWASSGPLGEEEVERLHSVAKRLLSS